MRHKFPFYVSFNIEDEFFNVNREVYLRLENLIFDKINELIKN